MENEKIYTTLNNLSQSIRDASVELSEFAKTLNDKSFEHSQVNSLLCVLNASIFLSYELQLFQKTKATYKEDAKREFVDKVLNSIKES